MHDSLTLSLEFSPYTSLYFRQVHILLFITLLSHDGLALNLEFSPYTLLYSPLGFAYTNNCEGYIHVDDNITVHTLRGAPLRLIVYYELSY